MNKTDGLIIVVFGFAFAFLCACSRFFYRRKKNRVEAAAVSGAVPQNQPVVPPRRIPLTNRQEDIYHISGQVQGQNQWPTHDGHLSLDNFTIANETNKYNDNPPTYEEAMHFASLAPPAPKSTTTPPTTAAASSH